MGVIKSRETHGYAVWGKVELMVSTLAAHTPITRL